MNKKFLKLSLSVTSLSMPLFSILAVSCNNSADNNSSENNEQPIKTDEKDNNVNQNNSQNIENKPEINPESNKPNEIRNQPALNKITEFNSEQIQKLSNLFQLNKNLIPSFESSKVKVMSGSDFNITGANVVAYNDSLGTLSFNVSGTYLNNTFENLTVNLDGFATRIIGTALQQSFNKNKVAERQNNLDEVLKLTNKDLVPYFTDLKILTNGLGLLDVKSILDNDNSPIVINNLSIKKNSNNKYTLIVNVDYKTKTLANGVISEETRSFYFGSLQLDKNMLAYSTFDYINYVLQNHVQAIDISNDNTLLNHYASYYVGRYKNEVDLSAQFYEVENAYSRYQNIPLQLKVKHISANDLTGTLYVDYAINYHNESSGENIEVNSLYKEITNFKKVITPEIVKKDFFTFLNIENLHGSFASNSNKGKLILSEYEKHKNDPTAFVLSDPNTIKRIFSISNSSTNEITFYANGLNKINTNSLFIPYYEGRPLNETEALQDKGFINNINSTNTAIQIGLYKIEILSLSDFKEDSYTSQDGVTSKKICFNINTKLTVGIMNSTTATSETYEDIEINPSSIYTRMPIVS
ncbi:hypothetical protein [Mycoplasmopsis felifaucium]|uniref:hypothetical protein n=1 Tax=Mycoplasmopsis felifaucium TaxID=35768 RepID=UPI000488BB7B|nr:hypothetical protein [Mycoplasmopsis felifaucium]